MSRNRGKPTVTRSLIVAAVTPEVSHGWTSARSCGTSSSRHHQNVAENCALKETRDLYVAGSSVDETPAWLQMRARNVGQLEEYSSHAGRLCAAVCRFSTACI